jgi:hypothetical protein
VAAFPDRLPRDASPWATDASDAWAAAPLAVTVADHPEPAPRDAVAEKWAAPVPDVPAPARWLPVQSLPVLRELCKPAADPFVERSFSAARSAGAPEPLAPLAWLRLRLEAAEPGLMESVLSALPAPLLQVPGSPLRAAMAAPLLEAEPLERLEPPPARYTWAEPLESVQQL